MLFSFLGYEMPEEFTKLVAAVGDNVISVTRDNLHFSTLLVTDLLCSKRMQRLIICCVIQQFKTFFIEPGSLLGLGLGWYVTTTTR